MSKNWIAGAINPKHRGELHKQLGVPMGQKIPHLKLLKASKAGGILGKRASLALTLSKFVK